MVEYASACAADRCVPIEYPPSRAFACSEKEAFALDRAKTDIWVLTEPDVNDEPLVPVAVPLA